VEAGVKTVEVAKVRKGLLCARVCASDGGSDHPEIDPEI